MLRAYAPRPPNYDEAALFYERYRDRVDSVGVREDEFVVYYSKALGMAVMNQMRRSTEFKLEFVRRK